MATNKCFIDPINSLTFSCCFLRFLRCVKQAQALASQQFRLFLMWKNVLLRGLDEVAAAEPTGRLFSYACFIFTLLQVWQMTPDLKVRAKNRHAYLLKSIRAILKFILNTFKSFASTVTSIFLLLFLFARQHRGILKRNKNLKSL